MVRVRTGAELLLSEKNTLPKGAKLGLVCNPTAVIDGFVHLADALIDGDRFEPAAIFGPEHGFFSTAQDQVGVRAQSYRGIPVYSLYGENESDLWPTDAQVEPLDALVFDIQDVGSRYYTYVWTMTGCMEVCARLGKKFIVLDRPNPIGGHKIEGPVLDPGFSSFVGRHPIAIRHGMTSGEIAAMVNQENGLGCDLTVLICHEWDRGDWYNQTALPWIMPSPNMPTLDTATVYPGGCLIEGANLSEGRGTTHPFEIIGAPFLDGIELACGLNALSLPGVHFRPIQFEPTFHKFAGQMCEGVFVHVTDRERFLPVKSYLALIIQAREMAKNDFDWRQEPYEYVSDRLAIDLLFGTDSVRKMIESGEQVDQIEQSWQPDLAAFAERRKRHLIYGRPLGR